MWRICAWCLESKGTTVIGCYDNNGDKHNCKGCEYQNCPAPLAPESTGICDKCLEERRVKKYQDEVFDGVGIS